MTEGLEDVGDVDAEMVSSSFSLPSKLRQTSYFQKTLSKPNAERNHLIQRVKENLNDVIAKKSNKVKKCNLSFYERKGLEWLSKKVMNEEIFVTEADKGGAILLNPRFLLEQKIKEKFENRALYELLKNDPRKEIYDEMIFLWKKGKNENFVTELEAQEIVGITKNNNKSSAARFKPDRTYFRPSLKIHKLKPEVICHLWIYLSSVLGMRSSGLKKFFSSFCT